MRDDLTPGQQVAQAMHVALAFFYAHPKTTRRWMDDSNYIVVVSVPDEAGILDLALQAEEAGISFETFDDSDYGVGLTAIALQPGPEARQVCARLPLAMKNVPTDVTVGVPQGSKAVSTTATAQKGTGWPT